MSEEQSAGEAPSDKVTHNPRLYEKLSEPFESLDAMNEAWLAFQTELRELRAKHRVRDVTIIMEGSFLQDGEVGEARVCTHNGNSLRKLPALAFAYGEAKAEQDAMLAEQERAGARMARRRGA